MDSRNLREWRMQYLRETLGLGRLNRFSGIHTPELDKACEVLLDECESMTDEQLDALFKGFSDDLV